MCGIVSVISKRTGGFLNADIDLFEGLLVLDTLRGLDSTGVFCVDSGRHLGFMKVASHPYHLFATQEYPKFRAKAFQSGRILVGHNRKATQGSINSANAHPFHAGNIVLVHNGTLRGDHKKDYAPVDVDSHALAIAFDEKGAENVIPTINGAFALIWWDIEKSRLFAVRNDDRPLEIVETVDNYYVLSEGWMAMQLLARDRQKVLDVHSIEAGKLYEFKIGGDHTIKDIELRKEPVVYHTGRGVYQGGFQSSVSTGKPGAVTGPNQGSGTTTQAPASTSLTLVKQEQSGAVQPPAKPLPMDMANHIPCEDFHRGQTVLVKFYEMTLDSSGSLYFCRGKCAEPNCPEIDTLAYMKSSDFKNGDQLKYLNKPVECKVQKHTSSSCGRSLYVSGLTLPDVVKVHNNDLTQTEWDYVTVYEKCGACDSVIFDEEQRFTSVIRRPNNQYHVTCADCIEDTLKGEAKHAFNQDRLTTVQAIVSKRDSTGGSTDTTITTPGPTTLQ